MNTRVIYASHFGNTERLARTIATALSSFGPTEAVPAGPLPEVALEGVDVVIVASPTEGFRQMPAMRAFLEQLPSQVLERVRVTCFDTRIHMPWPLNGSAAKGMARQLRGKGARFLVSPESFFVQSIKGTQGAMLLAGEEERAVQWALNLHERYEAVHPHLVASSS